MELTEKNITKWKSLYAAAEAFRDRKPWKHFDDSFIFGIQDPESSEIGWCVIMGAAGEVFGLMVYSGEKGLEGYEDIILSFGEDNDMSIAMNQTGFKVEFVNKDEVDKVDLKAFKQLGLQFQGRNEYISIRRVDPDLFPWYIEEKQAVFLSHCLEQSIQVVENALKGEVAMTDYDFGELLVMVPGMNGGRLKWEATYVEFPEFEDMEEYEPNTFIVNRLRKELKKKDSFLFFSFQYMMNPVQEKEGQRPYFPKLALWMDGESGLMLDFEIIQPENFWNNFQDKLAEIFNNLKYIPATIGVDSYMGMDVLDGYSVDLGIDLVYAPDHPLFKDVKESMGKFL